MYPILPCRDIDEAASHDDVAGLELTEDERATLAVDVDHVADLLAAAR
jgi:hypothetical protein